MGHSLVVLRRFSQVVFFLLFLILLFFTRNPLRESVPWDFFIQIDPLLTAAILLAAGIVVSGIVLSVVVLLLTLVLGRFFCGWVCPLGTTLDVAARAFAVKKTGVNQGVRTYRKIKYGLLIAILLMSFLGVQIVGWFDPISLSCRTFGTSVIPYGDHLLRAPLTYEQSWEKEPTAIQDAADKAYGFLYQNRLIEGSPFVFQSQVFIFLIFCVLLALLWYHRRFWCRNLCILGAFLAIFSRWRKVTVAPGAGCDNCNRCVNECRMGALRVKGEGKGRVEVINEECIQCFSCVDVCHNGAMQAQLSDRRYQEPALLPGRRGFVLAAAAGVVAVPMLGRDVNARTEGERIIRPPGSLAEGEFLDACIRCGECMKVCPTNALHPALLESGLYGLWTPLMIASVGYCSFECRACCQICPTDAIEKLTLEKKQKFVMGTAFFDTSRCIPYVDHRSCIKCEEHCPTPDKSIKFREEVMQTDPNKGATIKVPYVDKDLCIGCGICEYVCPVSGPAGIYVDAPQKNYFKGGFGGDGGYGN